MKRKMFKLKMLQSCQNYKILNFSEKKIFWPKTKNFIIVIIIIIIIINYVVVNKIPQGVAKNKVAFHRHLLTGNCVLIDILCLATVFHCTVSCFGLFLGHFLLKICKT